MKKFIFLSIMIFFPLNAFAVCNADTTFDATVTVDIPKPKGFFSGTPKPSPDVISEGITKAKQSVLQKFISKCVTERNKLDQYLKVKETIDSQTDSFVNVTKSKQDQKDLKLKVKVDQVNRDTFAETSNFFSYRRSQILQEKDYGRCISVISLISSKNRKTVKV